MISKRLQLILQINKWYSALAEWEDKVKTDSEYSKNIEFTESKIRQLEAELAELPISKSARQ